MWSVPKVIVVGHDVVLLAVAFTWIWFRFACQIALLLIKLFSVFHTLS